MPFSTQDALMWIQRLISIAIIFQTIELLQMRKVVSPAGIWTWDIVKREFEIFPRIVQKSFHVFLSYPAFKYLLVARLLLAVLCIFYSSPVFLFILFLSTILICLRWLGTFNGGSDFMTLIILMVLSVAT